ncbi:hypothetical protein V2J09_002281 [Rumex salicifolius]
MILRVHLHCMLNRQNQIPIELIGEVRMGLFRALTMLVALVVVVEGGRSSTIGVNWGIIASQPLPSDIVVNMLKDNEIKKVKLFDSDWSTVKSLADTNIQVIVAVPNDQLHRFQDYEPAKKWVKENVTKAVDKGVDIRYVAIGNEPFLTSYNGSFTKLTLPAMKNIQEALKESGHGETIKTTIPLNSDVYQGSSDSPSGGDFRSDIKPLMLQIVNFLHAIDSVFMVNIYPYISLYQNPNFPSDFAFFDGGGRTINDNGKSYNNVFDANFDTLVWALKKNGRGDLKIVVGEVGWPTDGEKSANVRYAKRFYEGLMKKLAEKQGTPMRSGPLDVYLFSLLDENMKSVAPGPFERHWGIFTYDGKPKFQFNLNPSPNPSGNQEKKLVAAQGVKYMDNQWCVLDWEAKDLSSLEDSMGWVCARADCSPLLQGASCADLHKKDVASYAFNMYFQMNNQDFGDCDFKGLGRLTTKNATTKNCLFPIQIVSATNSLLATAVSTFLPLALTLRVAATINII